MTPNVIAERRSYGPAWSDSLRGRAAAAHEEGEESEDRHHRHRDDHTPRRPATAVVADPRQRGCRPPVTTATVAGASGRGRGRRWGRRRGGVADGRGLAAVTRVRE